MLSQGVFTTEARNARNLLKRNAWRVLHDATDCRLHIPDDNSWNKIPFRVFRASVVN